MKQDFVQAMAANPFVKVSGVPWAVAASQNHVLVAASNGAALHSLSDAIDGEQRIDLEHPCPVTGAAISRLGDVTATADVNGTIRVFLPATSTKAIATLAQSTSGTCAHVALSADGRMLAASLTAARGTGRLEILDWRTSCGVAFATSFSPARVALSDDSRSLLTEFHTLSSHGAALLCAKTGTLKIAQRTERRLSAALDAAGERFVVADTTKLVVVDAKTGSRTPISSYRPPSSPAVTMSRDGGRVIAASHSGSFVVWSTSTTLPLARLLPHAATVTGAALVDGARILATCGLDRCVRIAYIPTHAVPDQYDAAESARDRVKGLRFVPLDDAVNSLRAVVAASSAALHVPALDVDQIVEFAVRRSCTSKGVPVDDFERAARRVVSFLSKCNARVKPLKESPG